MNALRAYEAAARLGGFAAAAEELCVTPGAISQHIKTLEDWAGAPLFLRRSHGVRLTEAGQALLPSFSAAFDQMGQAVRALKSLNAAQSVHIAVLPSVAQLWLAPRLPALREALPALRISVSALETVPNLQREMFDLSLFLRTPTDSLGQVVLVEDRITPISSPKLAEQIKSPEDLSGMTILHDTSWSDDWPLWAAHVGYSMPNAKEGAQFSLYALAVAEARAGAGVLMGHEALVEADLAAGTLVQPLTADCVSTGKALVLETAPCAGDHVHALVALLTKGH